MKTKLQVTAEELKAGLMIIETLMSCKKPSRKSMLDKLAVFLIQEVVMKLDKKLRYGKPAKNNSYSISLEAPEALGLWLYCGDADGYIERAHYLYEMAILDRWLRQIHRQYV